VCHGTEQQAVPSLAVATRPLAQAPLGRPVFVGRWRGKEGWGGAHSLGRVEQASSRLSQMGTTAVLSHEAVAPAVCLLDLQQCLQHNIHKAELRSERAPHGPGSAAEPEHTVSRATAATTPSSWAGPGGPALSPRLMGHAPVTVWASLQQASGHLLRAQADHSEKGPPQDVLEQLLADAHYLHTGGPHNLVHLDKAAGWRGTECSHGPSCHQELHPSHRSLLASKFAR